jgi:hypothetical protein
MLAGVNEHRKVVRVDHRKVDHPWVGGVVEAPEWGLFGPSPGQGIRHHLLRVGLSSAYGLRLRRGVGQGCKGAFSQAVAVALDGQHVSMVKQPVKDGGCDGMVAKDLWPLGHRLV